MFKDLIKNWEELAEELGEANLGVSRAIVLRMIDELREEISKENSIQ